MALTSLQILEREPWAERVRALGGQMRAGLEKLRGRNPRWGTVRGRGLMLGIEVLSDTGAADPRQAGYIVEHALKHGLIILSGGVEGNILSLTPPFVITLEEIEFALEKLAQLMDVSPPCN
jgi:4-aminobutyrate aminotransferase-like enzyme